MSSKKAPIEFWFDFVSPYGYLASTQINEIAHDHGRTVVWKPFLLGAVFKVTGAGPLTDYPLKAPYMVHDMKRFARLLGVEFALPEKFPVSSVTASRAFYWLEAHHARLAVPFAEKVYEAFFTQGQDISSPEVVVDLICSLGVMHDEAAAGIADPAVKEKLRVVTEEAIERGVFGSPVVSVDGELFWGADRLWMVEEWLDTGGW